MRLARRLVTATLTVLSGLSASGQPAADPATWVPADALAYVGVGDTRQLGELLQRTASYRIAQDPQLKELRLPLSILPGLNERFLLESVEQAKERLAASLDLGAEDVRNPFGGPMAMYLASPRGESAGGPDVVLVVGVSDAALMREYYDQATRRFRDAADQHQTVAYGSHIIDYFTSEAAEEERTGPAELDEPGFGSFVTDEAKFAPALARKFGDVFAAEGLPHNLAVCLTNDRLIVAHTPEHVQNVLQCERAGNSLVETPAYQMLIREFQPLGSVRLLVNLSSVFDLMERVDGERARQALTVLGLRSAQSLIGHVRYDHHDFESQLELMILLSGERTGLVRILSMPNRPVTPPAAQPADTLLYASVSADPRALLDELEGMVRQDDPAAADQMRARTEALPLPNGETLNLRTELLENLCGPLTFRLDSRPPFDAQSLQVRLSLGQRDAQTTHRFLEKLSTIAPGVLLERGHGNTHVYDVPLLGLTLASTENALITGTTSALNEALHAPPRELATDPALQRAAALAPPEACGVLYINSRKMLEAACAQATNRDAPTSSQAADPARLLVAQIVERFTAGLSPEQLAAARQLTGHLAPRIITLASTPDGIRLTQIQLLAQSE